MRAAHPRARGLAREPVGPHHVGDRTTAACGATRGASGGTRCAPPTSCASTPTARSSRASGTSRPRSSSTPSCTAPAPTPRSSCTTIRTTRRCSRRWASCRAIVHQNSCIFDGELAFVDEYGGVEDAERRQVARDAGRRRERHPARAPRRDRDRADDRRGVLQGGRRSSACAASPTTSLAAGRDAERDPAPSSARALKPLLRQNTPARVLGRRGAHAARATNPRCWT